MPSNAGHAAMRTYIRSFVLALSLLSVPVLGRADFVVYHLPGSSARFVLQGKTGANPGGSVTFKHAKFGTLYFDLKDVKIYKVMTLSQQFENRLAKARSSK